MAKDFDNFTNNFNYFTYGTTGAHNIGYVCIFEVSLLPLVERH